MAEAEGSVTDSAELRAAPRISLVLRAAKLVGSKGEYLCILRDVSATGLKLRLFHPLPGAGPFSIELGTGERYPVEPVWEADGHAGLRFVGGPIDTTGLVDDTGPFPKRQLRLALDRPVMIRTNGLSLPAQLTDLSQHGARIALQYPLALQQLVEVGGGEIPPRHGRVQWRKGHDYGLVFHDGFRLDELALLVARIQNRSQSSSSHVRINH